MSYSFNGEVDEDRFSYWPCDPEPDTSDWCIYRVPHILRKGKEEAYTPQRVSVGPLHYGKIELKDTEQLKPRYVNMFFKRTNKKPEEVLAFIKNREQLIRKCYSEKSKLKSDEYVMMILRDAIFILELLLRSFNEDQQKDELLRIPVGRLALKLDLLLLENQLPYFLLEELYNSIASWPSFIDICLKFFRSLFFQTEVSGRRDFLHFTHMLRDTLVQHFPEDEVDSGKYEPLDPLPCATKLDESGVKFIADESRRLLRVRFEGGELRMPKFEVGLLTETVFRNTLAWEQCHSQSRTIICDYVILLDSLIEDERDAQFLVDAKIISNSLGDSKELASLFKKLRAEILFDIYHYNKIHKALNDHYNSKYNRNIAKLQRTYFPDIWRGTATVVGFVVLIFTFLGAIASVKQIVN